MSPLEGKPNKPPWFEVPSPVPQEGSPRGLGFTRTAHLLPASRPRCSCWTQPPSSRCLFPQSLPYPQERRPLQLHLTLQQRFLWEPLQLLMLPEKRNIAEQCYVTVTCSCILQYTHVIPALMKGKKTSSRASLGQQSEASLC